MRIVFVCTGNASRSAVAEVILRDKLAVAGICGHEADHLRDEVTRVMRYENWDRIVLFNDYCFGNRTDLRDPHYQTEYVYRTCFDTIERGCDEIVKKLKPNNTINT